MPSRIRGGGWGGHDEVASLFEAWRAAAKAEAPARRTEEEATR